jgi:hypothetical protein
LAWKREEVKERTKLVSALTLRILLRHPQQTVIRQRNRKVHRIRLVTRVVLKERDSLFIRFYVSTVGKDEGEEDRYVRARTAH